MSKEIVYLCPNGYLGGAERFVLETCTGHLNFGEYHPTIIFFNEGQAVEMCQDRKISYFLLDNKFKLSHPQKLALASREIRRLFIENKWPIYHATMPYAHIVGNISLLGLNIKKTWYQHGPVGGVLDQLASSFPVDQIYFNSQYTKDCHNNSLLMSYHFDKQMIIPPGIAFEDPSDIEVDSLKSELKITNNEVMLLSAGRICSWKGYETTILAFSQILENNPKLKSKCRLFIAGDIGNQTDGPYKDFLINLVSQYHLEENVIFLGKRNDLSTIMKACDIFIHSSTKPEPYGLVIGEAMLQEALVIGTNSGGSPDLLIDGKTGYSFNSNKEKAEKELAPLLFHTINQHIINSPKIEKMRKQGKSHIKENHSISHEVHCLERSYDQLLWPTLS